MNHAVAQLLRHYATNRKVAGSTPNGVIGIFHLHNSSGGTMFQRLTLLQNKNEDQDYFLGVRVAGA